MLSRRRFQVLALIWLPLLCGPAWTALGQDAATRVLVITGGHAYEEEPFRAMFAAMDDVTPHYATYPAVAEQFTPELADRFDVLVFYDMWAKGMSPEQRKGLVDLLGRGIGVVALHHTLAAHQNWPEYAEIIGGKYHLKEREGENGQTRPKSAFSHGQDVVVEIARPDHPITRGLDTFEIHDETYQHYDTDPGATVLLTTSHPKSDRELAWTKQYANSRVVYIELGHDHHAYQHAVYRQLVARSIHYVAAEPTPPGATATQLFNGKDLIGWTAAGNARWEVKDGMLVGRQGEDNAPGDLFTEQSFDDFELKVTYRVVWPANSGVWYRYQSGRKAFQADILRYKQPFALSGSLYRPGIAGKPFVAINTNADIIDQEGWNTLVIRADGDHHQVFLNGVKTADVRDDLSLHGKIGFQVHAGDQFADMRIVIRQVELRPLADPDTAK